MFYHFNNDVPPCHFMRISIVHLARAPGIRVIHRLQLMTMAPSFGAASNNFHNQEDYLLTSKRTASTLPFLKVNNTPPVVHHHLRYVRCHHTTGLEEGFCDVRYPVRFREHALFPLQSRREVEGRTSECAVKTSCQNRQRCSPLTHEPAPFYVCFYLFVKNLLLLLQSAG